MDEMQEMIPQKSKGVYVYAVHRMPGQPMEIERRAYEHEQFIAEQRRNQAEVPLTRDYS